MDVGMRAGAEAGAVGRHPLRSSCLAASSICYLTKSGSSVVVDG